MMRTALRPLNAALLVLSAGAGFAQPLPKPIVSPAGFRLTPAAGWREISPEKVHASQYHVSLILFATPSDGFAPNFTVLKNQPPSPGETPQVVEKELRQLLPTLFHHSQVVSTRIGRLDGAPAVFSVTTYENGTPVQKVTLEQVTLVDGDRSFVLSLTTLSKDHAKFEPAFQQMIHSFHRS